MKKKWLFWSAFVLAVLLLLCILLVLLIWFGIFLPNNSSASAYPVHGVDVSHYQGEIDWKVLSEESISFAFIKATEGSSTVDPCFARNWAQAQETALRIGAYHFFSFESGGDEQADLFIQTVSPCKGMLPPVVDVEFYGRFEKDHPSAQTVQTELQRMLARLEQAYGMRPILYATEETYRLYLADAFPENDIWIRNVLSTPHLSDGREWTFWQYTNRKRLPGYQGDEPYIDMNVFYGSKEAFRAYGLAQ